MSTGYREGSSAFPLVNLRSVVVAFSLRDLGSQAMLTPVSTWMGDHSDSVGTLLVWVKLPYEVVLACLLESYVESYT